MLTRRYAVRIDYDNDERPFIIQNAPICRNISDDIGIEPIEEEEAKAPGLRICPHLMYGDDDQEAMRRFESSLTSSFNKQELPPEIIDAICGRKSDWKVIRCVPQQGSIFFMLINPHQSLHLGELCEHGDNVTEELKAGIFWAYYTPGDVRLSDTISIDVQDQQRRYRIWTEYDRYLILEEYDANGDLCRHSSVNFEEGTIDVTEFI